MRQRMSSAWGGRRARGGSRRGARALCASTMRRGLLIFMVGCTTGRGEPELVADAGALETGVQLDAAEPDTGLDAVAFDTTVLDTTGDTSSSDVMVEGTSATDAKPDADVPDGMSGWGCAENDKLCVCYDTPVAGYVLPKCAATYPCCYRYKATMEAGVHNECVCYQPAYLDLLGRDCTGAGERIKGIGPYSDVTKVGSCP